MKPPGTTVRFSYDAPDRDVQPGDVLFTPDRPVLSHIESARRQTRGVHIGRWHLTAVVLPDNVADLPADVVRHGIEWYPRPRKQRRTS